jgi:hypothetical protein
LSVIDSALVLWLQMSVSLVYIAKMNVAYLENARWVETLEAVRNEDLSDILAVCFYS